MANENKGTGTINNVGGAGSITTANDKGKEVKSIADTKGIAVTPEFLNMWNIYNQSSYCSNLFCRHINETTERALEKFLIIKNEYDNVFHPAHIDIDFKSWLTNPQYAYSVATLFNKNDMLFEHVVEIYRPYFQYLFDNIEKVDVSIFIGYYDEKMSHSTTETFRSPSENFPFGTIQNDPSFKFNVLNQKTQSLLQMTNKVNVFNGYNKIISLIFEVDDVVKVYNGKTVESFKADNKEHMETILKITKKELLNSSIPYNHRSGYCPNCGEELD